jgi:DNA-binding NtrC family response regulator
VSPVERKEAMRQSPRVSVNLPVMVETYGEKQPGRVVNLGLGGVFVALAQPPPVNTVATLSLFLAPHLPPLELLARVVRQESQGLGAAFLDVSLAARMQLQDYLVPLLPRQSTTCPFCGATLPRRGRRQCPHCRHSLSLTADAVMAESEPEEMIGTCDAMRQVFTLIRKVAGTEVPVLITGASGTGKEMVARAIHERSRRARGPFVAVNCGAIPRELLESELFGHEKGAFTGAYRTKAGQVEQAQGGTLFLDEVGELPVELQVKLLRFLQDFAFLRVGGRQTLKADVRLISATNSDLKEHIYIGRFREDLYYRLDVVNINLPPLKDRGDDAVIMANLFLKRYGAKIGKELKGFTPEAVRALTLHAWPGNVRELINRVRRAVVLADTPWVTPDNLGLDASRLIPEPVYNGKTLKQARAEFEARLVEEALRHFQGNVHMASRALKVSRSTLYHFIQKYRLKTPASLTSN